MGRHIWALSAEAKEHTVEAITVVKGFSIVPSTLGRISVALYQYRLLHLTKWDWKNVMLISVLVMQPIINIIAIAEVYGQCGTHLSALWNPAVAATTTCLNTDVETNLGYGQSGKQLSTR